MTILEAEGAQQEKKSKAKFLQPTFDFTNSNVASGATPIGSAAAHPIELTTKLKVSASEKESMTFQAGKGSKGITRRSRRHSAAGDSTLQELETRFMARHQLQLGSSTKTIILG